MVSCLEYLSFILATIGLPLAVLGVFFPKGAIWLEKALVLFANQRKQTSPEWKWNKFKEHSAVQFFIMAIPYQLAGAVFYVNGLSWEVFLQFLFILFILTVFFLVIAGLAYVVWFFIKVVAWIGYITGYLIVCISQWINPKSEVIPGVGVLLAVSSFFVALVPFFSNSY